MENASRPVYRVGDVEVDTARACLRRADEEVPLRPRPMQVLVYLLEQRQRLVTKEELLSRFWKDTAVTDDALSQCLSDIRQAFGDSSREPRIIRTVPKLGYRVIAQVEEVAAPAPAGADVVPIVQREITTEVEIEEVVEERPWAREPMALPPKPSRPSARVAIAVFAAAIAIAGLWWLGTRSDQSKPTVDLTLAGSPGRKAVVILYLDNQSKSAEFDWLREGLADMLIANLSRSSQLAVLSRQQLHLLLEQIGHRPETAIDLPAALAVARRSQATVVALGSFAVLGQGIRVTVQLHDADSGRVEAIETAEAEMASQIPAQVERLSVKLAAQLGATIGIARDQGQPLSVMTESLEAYRYYSLGVTRANAFDTKAAVEFLEKAVSLDPGFSMAYARLGYTHAVTGFEPEKGRPYLERAYELSARLTEKDRLLITSWHAIASLDYEAGIGALRRVITSYPAEAEAYLRLSQLLRGEDRLDEAIDVAERGVAINPDSVEALRELGTLYQERGDTSRAVALLRKAIAIAPNDASTHERLGQVFRGSGQYHEAVESYRRALTLDPTLEMSALGLGNVAYDRGRYREALSHYQGYLERKIPLGRWCAQAHRFSAAVYLRVGDLDRAGASAEAARACDSTAIWYALLVAYERGDRARAATLLTELERSSPPAGRGLRPHRRWKSFERGTLVLRSGNANEAIEHFKQALRYRPVLFNIVSMDDCLANAYLEIGRLDEAIAEYQRLLRLNSNDALSHYRLGLAYEKKGMKAEAGAEFSRFLQIWKDADPDVPELREARRRLGAHS